IPRIELRRIPERALVEGLFRALRPRVKEILAVTDKLPTSQISSLRSVERYVLMALGDERAYAGLTGEAPGRLPALGNVSAPSISSTEGSMMVILSLFRILRLTGYRRVLVLVDEAEALFLAYSSTNL